jgi:multiple sugar transport system substrate-binding protein
MHITKRRGLAAVVPLVIAGFALAGCSGGGETSSDSIADKIAAVTDEQLQGTSIDLARFFGDCTDTVGDSTDTAGVVGECATIQTLTNKFNAENKWGITVTRLGGASWDSYYDALNAAIAAGDPPDVAIMHASSIPDYAGRNLLLPLDDLTGKLGIDLSDAVPAAQDAIKYDGATYAVPFDVHGLLAHVNVDLFAQAGLLNVDGTPKLPTSTEEFIAQAKIVKETTGKDYFAIPRVDNPIIWWWVDSLIEQQGSAVLSDDLAKANIDTPEARNAIEFVNQIFADGYGNGNQDYDSAQASFLAGDAAILFNGTWAVDQHNKDATFKYEATNLPTLFEKPASWGNLHTWTIPTQKDADPVKYRAALEFIKFLYAHDADWALGTGHISVRTSVLDSDEYKSAPQRATYADTALNVRPVPQIANWPATEKVLRQTLDSIWFQGASIDDALKEGSANINSALKNG